MSSVSEDVKEDKEAIRAAAVKELDDLTSSLTTDDPDQFGRYANAWNEETWEQEFDSHPLFMSKPADDPSNLPPLVEAMRQLHYDPDNNTSKELADKYRKDGNENFRLKRYREASRCRSLMLSHPIEPRERPFELIY